HRDYAGSLHNLGLLYQQMREYDKALPLYLEALEIEKATIGEKHPGYLSTWGNLATLYLDSGKHDKALSECLAVLKVSKQVLGDRPPGYAPRLGYLSELYDVIGKPKEAAKYGEQALLATEAYLDDAFALAGEHQRNRILQDLLRRLHGLLSRQERAEASAP